MKEESLRDLKAYGEEYPNWLERNRSALEVKDWGSAFGDYPVLIYGDCPWAPMEKPLSSSRLGLLSTAGVYMKDDQPPFDAENIEGDWRFRELDITADKSDLAIAHTHFDHKYADADLNSVLPLDRLQDLVTEGVIGSLAPKAMSISGYCLRPDLIWEHTAPAIVAKMKEMEVDALLHIPV